MMGFFCLKNKRNNEWGGKMCVYRLPYAIASERERERTRNVMRTLP